MVVLAWILIALGAVITFVGGALINKKIFKNMETKAKCVYAVKSVGMWIVIIGAALIFIENGTFGTR